MDELAVPETHHHIGPTRHARVHRTVTQKKAEYRIMWIGRRAPDGIAGIDIFQTDLYADLIEIGLDLISQKDADISEANVSARIPLTGFFQKILSRAFCHHDHRMRPLLEPLLES